MTSIISVPTPVNIRFRNFVCPFLKFATFIGIGTCGRTFTVHEASRTIPLRIELGSGATWMNLALSIVTGTDAFVFGEILTISQFGTEVFCSVLSG